MNKAFDRILDRLKEERELSYADFSRYVEEVSPCLDAEYDDFFHRGLERASRLVKELAEEYNNGWISCSDRLPEDAFGCLVTIIDCEPSTQTDFENILPYVVGYDGDSWNDSDGNVIPFEVIAWQPLPEPFKECD